jgi:tetratricopeptide (TPR) repeat protein
MTRGHGARRLVRVLSSAATVAVAVVGEASSPGRFEARRVLSPVSASAETAAHAERADGLPPDPARELSLLRAEQEGRFPPAAQTSSRRLARIGIEFLSTGDTAQAIEVLSEAVALDERNGLAIAELTLAYLKNGDLEFAQFYLRQARQIAAVGAADPQIYAALGYVYESQGRIDDAILAWEEAVSLGDPDPRTARRLERARREWAVSHGQSFLKGGSFGAFYDPAIGAEVVEETLRYLESRRDELTNFFGRDIGRMPVAVLYKGTRYFAVSDSPEWVGAVYDGRIHVPVPPDGAESEGYRGLLSHELAHAYITELSRGQAPGWLQEGIAEYVEGRRIQTADAALSFTNLTFSSAADLSAGFSQRSDWERARAAYRLALFCVQELVADYGTGAVACVVKDLSDGRTIEGAVSAETGSSLPILENGWRRKLREAGSPRTR